MQALEALEGATQEAESALQPLLQVNLKAAVKSLSTVDNARLNGALAFAGVSLLFSLLRTRGVDTRGHRVMTEVEAVRGLFARVAEVERRAAAAAGAASSSSGGAAAAASASTGSAPLAGSKRAAPEAEAAAPAAKRARPSEGGVRAAAVEKGSGSDSEDDSEEEVAPGKAAQPAKRSAFDSKRRSTPLPSLGHLTWKQEMEAKLKRGKGT